MIKCMSAKFQKMVYHSDILLRIQRLEANSVDPDKAVHYEMPHQDLCCLLVQLYSFLALKC